MDESELGPVDDRPTQPINPWAAPPSAPPTPPPATAPATAPATGWAQPAAQPSTLPFALAGAAPEPVPPPRRVSRLAIGAVVVSVVLAGGTAFWLNQASHDRDQAQVQVVHARSDLAHQQALARTAHDELSQAIEPGRALDSAVTKPMATMEQLNALNKNTEAQMTLQLQTGEAGISGSAAYNRAVDAANADVDQGNNIFQQLMDETKNLPVD
jgi:hypothetical protein